MVNIHKYRGIQIDDNMSSKSQIEKRIFKFLAYFFRNELTFRPR